MSVKSQYHLVRLTAVAALAVLAGACATIAANRAEDTEALLAAAGFRMKPADTPEKLAHVKSLTQHTLVPQQKDGATVYVYADASTCRCLYAGSEDAYRRFQELARQRQMELDQLRGTDMNDATPMNWGVWGTGPWWLY